MLSSLGSSTFESETMGIESTLRRKDGRVSNFISPGESRTPDRAWQAPILRKICQFLEMPAGWDGYKAPRIGHHTAMFALQILDKFMRPGVPSPNLVPSSVGGIQIEWHEKGIDFEIHVTAPYEAEYYFEDRKTGADYGDEITGDLANLITPFAALSR